MRARDWLDAPAMRPAIAAFVAAALFAGWSGARLLRADALPTAATGDPFALPKVTLDAPPQSRRATPDDDLFSPDRTPRDARYVLPEDRVPVSEQVEVTPVVLGTALATDGASFVSARLADGPARTLRVGDTIGTYRLRSIDRHLVVFSRASGGRVEVRPGTPVPSARPR